MENPIKEILIKSNTEKRKTILLIVIILVVCIVPLSLKALYDSKLFNDNVRKGNDSFSNEKFNDAETFYSNALKYRTDQAIVDKQELSKNLSFSLQNYNLGLKQFDDKNYLDAYRSFSYVSAQDTKRYKDAQSKEAESKKMYTQDEMTKIDQYANSKDYQKAINEIQNLTVTKFLDENVQKELLQRRQQYNDLLAKQNAEAETKAKAEADAQAKLEAQKRAEEEAKAKALAKTQGVRIGMTQQQVLDSSWGRPNEVNRTVTANGTHEQWVYDNGGYLYFDNGILTAVQN
ncbi:hypothetical protein Desaci_2029 [Desulfosporosinus acidiphilus SJ4]|uniref:Uncharacterized protein n=1 Tax=Desulfosporosinus acidiphilus (strain DSM 22704 / JCM 16185 / SJ4) TaxID=646529 RepID=I4D5D0_DESAJ|nr:hypothetical protein [Desulfosporosinus acidiphilus]AFM41004.1 hypothetical protein Desaci_2029 [Desulfosporosinus acidiphilus SJ4]